MSREPSPPHPRRRVLARGLGLALLLAAAPPARAQQSVYFGNEAAMTAAAGMALYRGADAAYYNPAGLGGLQRTKVEISGTAFVLRLRDFSGLLTAELPSGRYRPTVRAVDVMPVPGALVFTRGVHPRVTLGLGIFVTAADQVKGTSTLARRETYAGSELDFLQRAVFKHQLNTYHLGPVIGWQVTPRLRLGWSLLALYRTSYRHLSLVVDARTDASAPEPIQSSSTFDYEQESTLFGARLVMGLQWEVARRWHLGLVVRSPSLSLWQIGETTQLVTAAQLSPGAEPFSMLGLDASETDAAFTKMVEPAEVVIGLAYRHWRFWIGAEGEIRLAVRNPAQLIDDQLQWNVRVGSRFWFTEALSIGLGGFTDRSPAGGIPFVGDYRVHYYGFALGLHFQSTHAVQGRARPDGLIFSTTLGLRYAAGVGDARGYSYRYPPTSPEDQQWPTQEVRFHDLALHLGSSLYF